MEINVSQLLKEPTGSSRNYEVSEIIDVTGDGSDRQVEGEVSLVRTQRGILVSAKLRTEVGLTCSRCLSSFNHPVTLKFEEEYLPTIDVVSGVPLPAPERGTFSIDEHHVLDLAEAIRQYALLAVPMKPLCRQGCAGLCQSCGQNLNRGACGCPARVIDPRWSELTRLL